MAAAPTKDQGQGPLRMMKRLTSTVSLFEPQEEGLAGPGAGIEDPELILFFAWYAAKDVHIAKYTDRYLALYPRSRLLLVKCDVPNALSGSVAKRRMRPVTAFVRALASRDEPSASRADQKPRPRILLHVFSNGGGTCLYRFLSLWKEATANDDTLGTGPEGAPLPPHVAVLDSSPGEFHYARTYRALSAGMPWWLAPMVHVLLCCMWLHHVALGKTPLLDAMCDALNGHVVTQLEGRRTYMYSREDEMVAWEDVEKHAGGACKVGVEVRKEMFVGSGHVAHARIDAKRYWDGVVETWQGNSSLYLKHHVSTK